MSMSQRWRERAAAQRVVIDRGAGADVARVTATGGREAGVGVRPGRAGARVVEEQRHASAAAAEMRTATSSWNNYRSASPRRTRRVGLFSKPKPKEAREAQTGGASGLGDGAAWKENAPPRADDAKGARSRPRSRLPLAGQPRRRTSLGSARAPLSLPRKAEPATPWVARRRQPLTPGTASRDLAAGKTRAPSRAVSALAAVPEQAKAEREALRKAARDAPRALSAAAGMTIPTAAAEESRPSPRSAAMQEEIKELRSRMEQMSARVAEQQQPPAVRAEATGKASTAKHKQKKRSKRSGGGLFGRKGGCFVGCYIPSVAGSDDESTSSVNPSPQMATRVQAAPLVAATPLPASVPAMPQQAPFTSTAAIAAAHVQATAPPPPAPPPPLAPLPSALGGAAPGAPTAACPPPPKPPPPPPVARAPLPPATPRDALMAELRQRGNKALRQTHLKRSPGGTPLPGQPKHMEARQQQSPPPQASSGSVGSRPHFSLSPTIHEEADLEATEAEENDVAESAHASNKCAGSAEAVVADTSPFSSSKGRIDEEGAPNEPRSSPAASVGDIEAVALSAAATSSPTSVVPDSEGQPEFPTLVAGPCDSPKALPMPQECDDAPAMASPPRPASSGHASATSVSSSFGEWVSAEEPQQTDARRNIRFETDASIAATSALEDRTNLMVSSDEAPRDAKGGSKARSLNARVWLLERGLSPSPSPTSDPAAEPPPPVLPEQMDPLAPWPPPKPRPPGRRAPSNQQAAARGWV